MSRLLSLFFLLLTALPVAAQQAQEELRASSQLVYPEFREGRVLQSFGRSIKAKVNILYKNAALVFIDPKDSLVRQAANTSVLGVQIDSVVYRKVDNTAFGRVVAERDGNLLLCVTTIDMKRYKEITSGGTDMPFFEIDMAGFGMNRLLDLTGAEQAANVGYPLRKDYYFSLKGRIVPAREKVIKQEISPEMRTAFRNLMADRWWSWRDATSLTQLLMYFPK